jgi:actin-related protein
MHDLTNPRTLVLDLGTANTKAGWTGAGEPNLVVPSVVGRGRHKGAMLTLGLKDSYVGRQAQNLQGILSLRHTFKGGTVQHWDDLELLWDHVWSVWRHLKTEIKNI